jgi:hypothetical protein
VVEVLGPVIAFPWRRAAQVAVGVVKGADRASAAEEIASLLADRDARHAEELREERARYHELVREMIDLVRQQHAQAPLPEPPKSPLAALGPRSTAALVSMSANMPPANRRAMEAEALRLWATTDGEDEAERDRAVAEAIRRGEPVRNY